MLHSKLAVMKEISIGADVAAVFAALTDPVEVIKHFPYESVTTDAKVGGQHVLRGTSNNDPFTDYGRIIEFEQDCVFQYRYWSDNHGTERAPENELCIRYELRQESSGCRLIVTHSNLPSIEYRDMIDEVWDSVLDRLCVALGAD